MSHHHRSARGEVDRSAAVVTPPSAALRDAHKPPVRRSKLRWRSFWFALTLALCAAVGLFALSMERGLPTGEGRAGRAPAAHTLVSVRAAEIRSYQVSPADAGLMLPVVGMLLIRRASGKGDRPNRHERGGQIDDRLGRVGKEPDRTRQGVTKKFEGHRGQGGRDGEQGIKAG